MATTLPKRETVSSVVRTEDDSFPSGQWLVKRQGNDPGRMPIPCVSCAQSVNEKSPTGFDPSTEFGGRFESRGDSDTRESFGEMPSPVPFYPPLTHRCPYEDSVRCTCRDRFFSRMSLTSSAIFVALVAFSGICHAKK